MPTASYRTVAVPKGTNPPAGRSGGTTASKHFHHKPTFSGDLAKSVANTAAGVSGRATCFVQNNPHDSHFRPQTVKGHYGTFAIDADGHYTYTLDHNNNTVATLAHGAHLTETIKVLSKYDYREMGFTNIVITIVGQ